MLFYREAKDGQLLEEGITEAGALSSWIAAATSYSVHGQPMLPFYIFYSMFGFQRVGDLIWAAADQRSRGFLDRRDRRPHDAGRRGPAASGRLESRHRRDGSELPRVRSGLRLRGCRDRRLRRAADDDERGEDVFYYLTVMNENYAQPSMPPDRYDDIISGMHRIRAWRAKKARTRVRLLGSGAILPRGAGCRRRCCARSGTSTPRCGA